MIKKQAKNNYLCVLLALLLLAVALVSGRYISPAFADLVRYTSVLADLQKDENFNADNYPDKTDDFSIRVIQIAEGVNKELFVYTYQPCQKALYLVASEINMSFESTSDNTKLCGLTLLNCIGVFCKYKVNGITVSDEKTRYYNITSIYRPFEKGIDKAPDNDNTVDSVSYGVGQLWTVTDTVDGGIEYSMKAIEVISITKQMIGFRRYSDGFQWSGTKSCDAHFLLFSCDHAIDKLISADIAFNAQGYEVNEANKITYGKTVAHKVTLHYDDKVGNDGSGWFGKKETWQRMASTSEFMKAAELRDDEKEMFKKYDWVLNFYETEYIVPAGGKDVLISLLVPFGFVLTIGNALSSSGTIVSDVTLLRLEFECNDEIYNLGVVSNRQTGSQKPTNNGYDFFDWLADKLGVSRIVAKWIFYCAIALVVLAIAMPVLSAVFPVIGQILAGVVKGMGKAFAMLFKALWWLICLPFKGIAALITKIKDRGAK